MNIGGITDPKVWGREMRAILQGERLWPAFQVGKTLLRWRFLKSRTTYQLTFMDTIGSTLNEHLLEYPSQNRSHQNIEPTEEDGEVLFCTILLSISSCTVLYRTQDSPSPKIPAQSR